MEDRPRIFAKPHPFLLSMMRGICQDPLRHAIELLPRNATSLEVLQSAENALSHLGGICTSLVGDMKVDEQSPTPVEVVEEVQNVI